MYRSQVLYVELERVYYWGRGQTKLKAAWYRQGNVCNKAYAAEGREEKGLVKRRRNFRPHVEREDGELRWKKAALLRP